MFENLDGLHVQNFLEFCSLYSWNYRRVILWDVCAVPQAGLQWMDMTM